MKKRKMVFVWGIFFLALKTFAVDWFAKDPLQPGHDPSIVRHEDGYTLMVTNNMMTAYSSEDALNWKTHSRAMNEIPAWLKNVTNNGVEDIWAPDLFQFGENDFRAYYTGSVFGKRSSGIGYLTSVSANPMDANYGWKDEGEIIHSVLTDKYNAIDADVMRDVNGDYWMAFGSFGLGIQVIKLDPLTGKPSSTDKTIYNVARRTTSASGGAVEGPSFIEHNGQYFLFTAWDICCQQGENIEQSTYKTAMGRADSPTGPYIDRNGKDLVKDGGTILLERYGRYYGPGGGDVFQDLNRVRFVHHYYDNAGDKFNHIHVRDVVFTDDNWAEMGQPFLGRYLSAEVEHGALTRSVSGDLVITSSVNASNGEYLAYINTSGTKIRLPMNIMQAGDYLLRYRYANGGEADASHKVTINGKTLTVSLPKTGAWGTFPENSIVMIPATLKRGGNFIEIEPNENFAELDRIDFLRIIRDTLPANGFDNGIRVRLTEKDEFAIKDGGYALFENVLTDSLKSKKVNVQLKQCAGGVISLRKGSKTGDEISKCSIPASCENGTWTEVECSDLQDISGIEDFVLTASGIGSELLIGNILFKDNTQKEDSSLALKPTELKKTLWFDKKNNEIRFVKNENWTLFDANGIAVLKGNGNIIRLNQIRSGFYLIRFGQNVFQIRLGK